MDNDLLPDGRLPVLLSAHGEDLVRADAAALLDYLDNPGEHRRHRVAEVAAHLLRTRRVRRHRAVIRAADTDELTAGLRALAAAQDHPLVSTSARGTAARVAFVIPGQGGQSPGMGAEAYDGLPAYRTAVDTCAAAFTAAGVAAPVRYLTTAADPDGFTEIEVQGAQFTHAVALAAVWRSHGVVADLTVGHSLGEVAAAYLAATIDLADAVAVLCARAGVVERLPGEYAVAALGITAEAAQELIADTPGWLELSVINGAASVAVSGDRAAVNAAVGAVQARGQLAREITVNFPVHTSLLDALRDGVQRQLPDAQFADSPVPFIGSVTGAPVPAGTRFPEYWYQNLRSTVRFDRAVDAAIRCGATTFVEMSNHPSLLHAVQDRIDRSGTRPQGPMVLIGSGLREHPLADQLSANITNAAVDHPGYRWRDRMSVRPAAPLRDFPNAPMRTQHLWAHPEPLAPRARVTVAAETWPNAPLPVPREARRVAVVPLGTDAGSLTARLTETFDAHPEAVIVTPADADLIVAVAPALLDSGAARSAERLSVAVGSRLFDYLDDVGARCRDIWLVTTGGEHIHPSHPPALPAQAALAAMHRSLGFEHPDQNFHHLDLPAAEFAGWPAAADTILAATGELALRQTDGAAELFRRQLTDLDHRVPTSWSLGDGILDNVVITGGAGAIGMHYARYLAEHGAKRIVLLSRHSADPSALAELAHRHGLDITSPRCDVTDRTQLAAVAAEHAGDGASLLIHAAGTATWDRRNHLTAAAVGDAFAAKVNGLLAVDELWPLRAGARTVLCSSVIGVWGGQGTAAYAAANRMLDVIAGQLRSQGRRCVAIKWGLWQQSGIVDAAETARVQRTGLRAMAPELAIEASLYDYPVDPVVYDADADRLHRFSQAQEVAPQPASAALGDTPAEVVRTELAAVLNVGEAATLDLEASLFDLGVDSLLALDLRKRMKQRTGQTVSLAILLGGITGSELIATLAGSPTGTESTEGGIHA